MKHRKWILLFVIAALLLSGCSVGAGDAERTAPGRLDWPTEGLAALLPAPNETRGEIAQNDADGLLVYVEDVSESAFSDYANACWKQGFSVQYRLTDDSFEADKISGEHLSLSLNQETLCIALRAAAERAQRAAAVQRLAEDVADAREAHRHALKHRAVHLLLRGGEVESREHAPRVRVPPRRALAA